METALKQTLAGFSKTAMFSFLEAHPEAFEEAIHLACSDDQPYAWRAAWLIAGTMRDNDGRVQDHVADILDVLLTRNDGHQRELLKILERMDLSDEQEGVLFDHCLHVWESVRKQSSVRVTAFRLILRVSRKYPDLAREVAFLSQDEYLSTLSPGIRGTVSRMVEEMKAESAAQTCYDRPI